MGALPFADAGKATWSGRGVEGREGVREGERLGREEERVAASARDLPAWMRRMRRSESS